MLFPCTLRRRILDELSADMPARNKYATLSGILSREVLNMPGLYSVREAAAIAELSPDTIRTALERKVLTSSSRAKAGKTLRHKLSVRDVLFLKLLTEFPFALGKSDKIALKKLVFRQNHALHQWRREGANLVFSSGDITVLVQCRNIRMRLAQNVAAFRWGKRRIVSDPSIMSGEPVFGGTRIPLEHVAAQFRKGVNEREIAEDFPKLTKRDLAFAKLYSRLGPPPGRPKKPIQLRRQIRVA
jgi:uncharacterized protein (DUF433 family)